VSVNLILAVNEEGALGYKNSLLYNIDLKRFKELTTYNRYGLKNYVLFGRKSYESLPSKPLPNRISVVVSRKEKFHVDDPHVVTSHSLENAINHYLSGEQQKDLWICGGNQIYEQSIKYADYIFLTYIHDSGKKADTYFDLNLLNDFVEVEKEPFWSEEYQCDYDFITYKRKI